MPDISMCDGKNCKGKKSCYRYTATPNPCYQSYLLLDDKKRSKDTCQLYWDNKLKGVKQWTKKA